MNDPAVEIYKDLMSRTTPLEATEQFNVTMALGSMLKRNEDLAEQLKQALKRIDELEQRLQFYRRVADAKPLQVSSKNHYRSDV